MQAAYPNKIRCIAADDEPLALELISGYIRRTPFLELAGAYSNGTDVWNGILSGPAPADLVFLDIQMPGLDGLEISRLIKEHGTVLTECGQIRKPRIIFTTAFEQYAVAGYKVDALDYLLKPVSYPEFLQAVSRARDSILHESERQEENRPSSGTKAPEESMFVKSEYKYVQIKFGEIRYIEGLKDYIKIYMQQEKNPVLTLMSMKSVEETLPRGLFIRIHRSYIVNTSEIRIVEKGQLILWDGKAVPIGDSYRDDVLKLVSRRGPR